MYVVIAVIDSLCTGPLVPVFNTSPVTDDPVSGLAPHRRT